MAREEALEVEVEVEDGLEQADVPPEGVEVVEFEELEEVMEATGLTPLQWAEAGGEVVVEASSHPSCPTACTLKVGASTRVPFKGLKTFQGGILAGARGLAVSEAARDPSTK